MEQNTVQSVERTFLILEALAQSPAGMPLAKVSAAAGLHKSTAHRLLLSLSQLGYVERDRANGDYKLSLKLFEIASRVVHELDIYTAAKPYLDALSRRVNEAVHLVVRSGDEVVYVYKVDAGNGSVRMASRVGLRAPMYCTAVGKCVLAFLPPQEADDIWARTAVVALTEHTVVDHAELRAQLEEVRRQGFARDNEENEHGVTCIAAPVFDFSGGVAGAFSISAPTLRADQSRMNEYRPLLMQASRDISREMGYRAQEQPSG